MQNPSRSRSSTWHFLFRVVAVTTVTVLVSFHHPIYAAKVVKGAAPVPSSVVPSRNLIVNTSGHRVALIIGNGAYRDMPKLDNPTNDSEDIAKALRAFGFEVLAYKNLTRREMKDAIAEFGRRASDADAALFYFAGHGLQVKSQNYLMPVDATARSEADATDEGVNVNFPLEEMDNAKSRVNIVMLDACRDNPLTGKFRSSGSRGLAAPDRAAKGTVIVYATDPGNTAADGDGRNGLFTAGLLEAFNADDLSLDGVLTKASELVEKGSKGKQTPYVNGPQLVKKNFQFAAKANAEDKAGERLFWTSIKDSRNTADLEAYLRKYPNGDFKTLAETRLWILQQSTLTPPSATQSSRDDAENQLWNEVKKSGDRDYLEEYLILLC